MPLLFYNFHYQVQVQQYEPAFNKKSLILQQLPLVFRQKIQVLVNNAKHYHFSICTQVIKQCGMVSGRSPEDKTR